MNKKDKRAQIWVSAVAYLLITIIVLVLLLESGLPLLENVRDKSTFTKTRDLFLNLNQNIKDVESEGAGSQRIIPFEIRKGTMTISDNEIKWEMETKAKIIEPRSRINLGELIISDDSWVELTETASHYIINNSFISVGVKKHPLATRSNPGDIETHDIIDYITYRATDESADGTFNFLINDEVCSGNASNGYLALSERKVAPEAVVITVHINDTTSECAGGKNFEYDLILTVEGNVDFVYSNIENIQITE